MNDRCVNCGEPQENGWCYRCQPIRPPARAIRPSVADPLEHLPARLPEGWKFSRVDVWAYREGDPEGRTRKDRVTIYRIGRGPTLEAAAADLVAQFQEETPR